MKGVIDIRVDHKLELQHMYSLLAVHRQVLFSPAAADSAFSIVDVTLEPSELFPSFDTIKCNLVVLVSHIICRNIKMLSYS